MSNIILKAKSKDGFFEVDLVDTGECNTLNLYYEGSLLYEFYDKGEPEDNSFTRDYMWIVDKLVDFYNYGYERGHDDGVESVELKVLKND